MITYVRGSVFLSPASTLVNTVNTRGVMGKGIAKVFRDAVPDMYERYRAVCQAGTFGVGDLLLYRTSNRAVLNFPTKIDWRKPSRLEYVHAGLQTFVTNYAQHGMTSVAFPQLGCGNGGLDWDDVRPLMEHYLADLPIDIYIHLYSGDDVSPTGWNTRDVAHWLSSPTIPWVGDSLWEAVVALLPAVEGDVEMSMAERETMVVRQADDEHWVDRTAFVAWWSEQPVSLVTMPALEDVFGKAARMVFTLFRRIDGAIDLAITTRHAPNQWDHCVHLLPPIMPLVSMEWQVSEGRATPTDAKQLAFRV